MPEDKEIRIRATLDVSQFDKGIAEIQRKLRTMVSTSTGLQDASTSQGGQKTLMGRYAKQAFGDFSKEAQGNLQKMSQMQRQEAVIQRISMREQEQQIKKLVESDVKLNKQQERRLKMHKEELDLLKKKHQQTILQNVETEKALTKIKGDAGGPGGPGGPPVVAGAGGFKSLLQAIGIGAVVKGAADAVVSGVEHMITRERKIAQAQGAAYQLAARPLAEQFAGKGARGMFFAGERAEAARIAAKEASSQDLLQILKTAAGTAAAAVAGGLVAGPFGAIAGGVAGFGGMMTGERARSQIFDREQFRAMISKEGMQNYEANLAAIKARTPRKVMAQQYFEQNSDRMAQLQSTLGFGTDEELVGAPSTMEAMMPAARRRRGRVQAKSGMEVGGESAAGFELRAKAISEENQRRAQRNQTASERTKGWIEQQIDMGEAFGGVKTSEKIVRQQLQQILQAGGTTAGARDLAGKAGAFGRQLNVQNVGALMGQISGAGSDVGQTEENYKRLVAEAVRMGVDVSKMPQEMQRMTQMTAALATAGGGFAQGAIDVAMAGVGGLDRTSIMAASTAAGMFKQTAKVSGGWEGQMGLGFLQSDEATKLAGKKLSGTAMNMINQLSFSEARPQDIKQLAAYLGVSEKNARELLRKKDIYKQSRTSLEASAYEDLGEFIKDQGVKTPQEIDELLSTGPGAKKFMAAKEAAIAAKGEKFSRMTPAQQEARILQQARMTIEGGEGIEGSAKIVTDALIEKEQRAARFQQGAEGTGDIARIQALSENIDALGAAAKRHSVLAEEYNTQFQLFKEAVIKGETSMDSWATSLQNIADDLATKQGILSGGAGDED